jgi:hypothetical protein
MKQQDFVEGQTESASEAIRQLQSELRASQRQVARLLEIAEKHQSQLTSHETSIARLDRILMELLTGRVWRTLHAAGNLAKKFIPSRERPSQGLTFSAGWKRSYLVIDEPKAADMKPKSGKVTVRGWCLAEGGVDAVQIEVPGLPVVQTTPSLIRPDVKKAHPDLDQTGRSGFALEFDSLLLPKGRFPVTIRLISKGKPVQVAKTAVEIDHEKGFASDYDRWIHEFERPDDNLIQLELMSFQYRPLISILMPVYNTRPSELKAAIQSVIDQSYSIEPEILTWREKTSSKLKAG